MTGISSVYLQDIDVYFLSILFLLNKAQFRAVLFYDYKDNSIRTSDRECIKDADSQKRALSPDPEGSSVLHFRTEEVSPVPVWNTIPLQYYRVTDHKPPISMFGPNTATPMLAANRIARWSLMLRQYNYTIEYRSTKQHGNADALSSLPVGPDLLFDGEEGDNDVDTVYTIRIINYQLQLHSQNQLKDATIIDPVLSEVKRYVREGWPQKMNSTDVQESSICDG